MMKKQDLTNRVFGKLTALEITKEGRARFQMWRCKCSCGREKEFSYAYLVTLRVKSCGCLNKGRTPKHGLSGTRFYNIWLDMKRRGLGKRRTKDYKDRGICICNKWLSLDNFKKDMYESYCKHCDEFGIHNTTIERVDNNLGYYPENCVWATYKEQGRNNRHNTVLSFNNQSLCISEWAEKMGVKQGVLVMRIKHGWSVEKALTLPKQRIYTPRKLINK